jgi:hypothetical protein
MRVEALDRNAPNQFIGEVDWMPMFEYLHSGADLLELGVKVANFPFDFKFKSVLHPTKDISILDGNCLLLDNEVACSIEIIISRYSYALSILKSCSGHLYKFREAAKDKSKDESLTLSKEIMERIKNSTLRIYKMWSMEAILLVSLELSSKDLKAGLGHQSSSQGLPT